MHLLRHGGQPLNTVTPDDISAILPTRRISDDRQSRWYGEGP